jgi:PTS system nitrogen regulatory IIA component
MDLKKHIDKDCIIHCLRAETKQEVIEEMLDRLVAIGKVHNREAALAALLDRESKMSTGMQHGIAIPHGKTDTVGGLFVAIGIKKEGIDFQSVDGEPSTIFIMTLSPASTSAPHIQFLAEVARLLTKEDVRARILNATWEGEIANIFTNG